MKIWLGLGGAAVISLAGWAVDPYAHGATPQYGGGSYPSGRNQAYGRVDPGATPTYGAVFLESGFDGDPYRVSVLAGGDVDASTLAAACAGTIARAPDFRLTYDAGDLPLTFGVSGEGDTTLVINGPDGRWTCDDDSGGGVDPEVTYRDPRSGTYAVWVGAFGGDGGQAELFVSERGSAFGRGGADRGYDGPGNGRRDDGGRSGLYGDRRGGAGRNGNGDADYPDSAATAVFGEVSLRSGFSNDPYTVSVMAGGGIDAASLDDGCVGRIATAPDFQLTYEAGSLPLTIGATSNGDVTLVVNGPDGQWSCDDDSGGDADPELTFRRPRSGVYDVWVGSYDGDSVSAELFFSELR